MVAKTGSRCCGGETGCCSGTKERFGSMSRLCGMNLLTAVLLFSLYSIITSTVEMVLTFGPSHDRREREAPFMVASMFLFLASCISFLSGVFGILATALRKPLFSLIVFYIWCFLVVLDIADLIAIALATHRDVWRFFTSGSHLLVAIIGIAVFYSYYRVLLRGGDGTEGKSADRLQSSFVDDRKKNDAASAYTISTRSSSAVPYGTDVEAGHDGEIYSNTPFVG